MVVADAGVWIDHFNQARTLRTAGNAGWIIGLFAAAAGVCRRFLGAAVETAGGARCPALPT